MLSSFFTSHTKWFLRQINTLDYSKDDGDFKRAFRWVFNHLKENPEQNVDGLIEEAVQKFNLPLIEAEWISIMLADISKKPEPTYSWPSFGL